jgi:hypothetical protein
MIDFAFIGSLEGRSLSGYVPAAELGNSGVTIATGCDLGHLTARALAQFPGPFRFNPYVHLFGEAAAEFLRAHPLTVSVADADAIDRVMFADDVEFLSALYARESQTGFGALPDRAQTVVASVGFQYGNPRRKCPRFWAAAVKRDWAGMVDVLRSFGDRYPTRRHREAGYLEPLLASAPAAIT